MSTQSAIPKGYTFVNPETMITVKGSDLFKELMHQADKRDPDAFDMYVYNDFFAYGVLDLVDKTLSTLHSKVTKKAWDEAYAILEGITCFMDCESVWTQCDDGQRVNATKKAYAALAIAIFKGLRQENRLSTTSFPSLECCLKNVTELGDMLDGIGSSTGLGRIARGLARKIFKDKTEEQVCLEKKYREEWLSSLDAEAREQIMENDEVEDGKDAEGDGKPWHMKGRVDDNMDAPKLALSRAWKDYRAFVSAAPKGPLRGGKSWDISTWSAATKAEFQFDNEDAFGF
ncbi:hypothetical protein CC2G_010678 [Coprinopsis cinerea AmutBmut pab1-1]|nr:hypothetical protein CC2G_010678 [Coprinopsis cinerea AmutBmut pab1-1]